MGQSAMYLIHYTAVPDASAMVKNTSPAITPPGKSTLMSPLAGVVPAYTSFCVPELPPYSNRPFMKMNAVQVAGVLASMLNTDKSTVTPGMFASCAKTPAATCGAARTGWRPA